MTDPVHLLDAQHIACKEDIEQDLGRRVTLIVLNEAASIPAAAFERMLADRTQWLERQSVEWSDLPSVEECVFPVTTPEVIEPQLYVNRADRRAAESRKGGHPWNQERRFGTRKRSS